MKHATPYAILALVFAALSDACPWPNTANVLIAFTVMASLITFLRAISDDDDDKEKE